MCDCKCQNPERLKGKLGECAPEQEITRLHGELRLVQLLAHLEMKGGASV